MERGPFLPGSMILTTLIALAVAASLGRAVLALLALALFVIALVAPLQIRLEATLPKSFAMVVNMVAITAVVAFFGWLMAWGFGRVAAWAAQDAAKFQLLYERLLTWAEGHGVAVATLWSEHFSVGWLLRALQGMAKRLNSMATFALIALVYVCLGLLELSDFRRKLMLLARRDIGDMILQGSAETGAKIRRYMIVRTEMSVLTGLLAFAVTWAFGLPNPAEWGVITFVLNYIPVIGPLIATLLPTAVALVQFETWHGAVAIFLALNVVQVVVGSYIEPMVSGSALSMSPVLVLFSVFFWTFLWGVFGAFIGVPIMIAVMTFCARHASTSWVTALFGAVSEPGSRPGRPSASP